MFQHIYNWALKKIKLKIILEKWTCATHCIKMGGVNVTSAIGLNACLEA